MKYYDKDIYEMSNKIELYVVIICVFIVSFILGYHSVRYENTEKETINNLVYKESKING